MKQKSLAIFLVITLLATLLTGTAGAASPPAGEAGQPHGAIAMRHIEFMNDNLPARTPFSYRELETARWIAGQLLDMGYAPEQIQMQQFSWSDVYRWAWRDFSVMAAEGFFRYSARRLGDLSQNVILTVPGRSEQVIIVGAHYDSFPYPGAADNASGTALLLESAQRMKAHDNYYTIVYIFFGAEESGLLGAEFYLASLSEEQRNRILFMVNADALFEGPYFLYSAGFSEDIESGVPQANNITRGGSTPSPTCSTTALSRT